MSYEAHKETIGEFILKIVSDDDAESPRSDDNMGTMVCFHNRYNLGDKHSYKEPQDFLRDLLNKFGTEKELKQIILDTCKGNIDLYRKLIKYKVKGTRRDQLIDMVEYLSEYENIQVENFPEEVTVLPLFLYDHSGITMSTSRFSCQWDSGQVGWIYVSKKEVDKHGLSTRTDEEIRTFLEGEVKTYDQFLTGDIYGFVVSKVNTCECCNNSEEEEVDSCWGFYGTESAIEEGKSIIEYLSKKD